MTDKAERPEYVKCVKFILLRAPEKTWCDGPYKPYFENINHAALNGVMEGRLMVCPECLAAITKALNNGYE